MAQQIINLGTGELTGDGESIRSAFDKINDNFTETYNDIANITTFDGDYNSLTNKPVLFSGDYNDLTNQPTLFDGAYNSLTGAPSIPADVSDLTDTTNLLDHFSGSYNDLTDKPIVRTVEITNASTITASRKVVTPDTHSGIELTTTPIGAPLLTLPDGSYSGQTYFVTENYQGGSNVDISVTNFWNKSTEAIETVTVTGAGQFVWTGTYWTKIG